MKMHFDLLSTQPGTSVPARVKIIGKAPSDAPYVSFSIGSGYPFLIPDEQLERFAVNILKALKSKKLNHGHKRDK